MLHAVEREPISVAYSGEIGDASRTHPVNYRWNHSVSIQGVVSAEVSLRARALHESCRGSEVFDAT